MLFLLGISLVPLDVLNWTMSMISVTDIAAHNRSNKIFLSFSQSPPLL